MNKKQQKAIKDLKNDLDELDNKPRRLFQSLRNFALAFKKNNERDNEIIDSINEFEEHYYNFIRHPELLKELLQLSLETKRELTGEKNFREFCSYRKNGEKDFEDYSDGVKQAIKELSKKMSNTIINNIN